MINDFVTVLLENGCYFSFWNYQYYLLLPPYFDMHAPYMAFTLPPYFDIHMPLYDMA